MSCTAGSQDCNFHCPKGGSWFVCEKPPYFVGCCASDPCSNTDEKSSGCHDLYPASFDPDVFDRIRPNACIGTENNNWYACNLTNPRFLGCCKSDPCGDGCPDDDLVAGAVGEFAKGSQMPLFLDGKAPTEDEPEDDGGGDAGGGGGLSSGAIAGIAVGAAVAAIIIAVLAFFLIRQQRRRRAQAAGVNAGLQPPHADESGHFYHAVPQNGDPRFSGTPMSPTSKHRASSSIGTSYGSPTLTSDSRPMSEVYAPSRADEYLMGHGLQIDGVPTSPGHIKVIPELDSTPHEVHELDGGR